MLNLILLITQTHWRSALAGNSFWSLEHGKADPLTSPLSTFCNFKHKLRGDETSHYRFSLSSPGFFSESASVYNSYHWKRHFLTNITPPSLNNPYFSQKRKSLVISIKSRQQLSSSLLSQFWISRLFRVLWWLFRKEWKSPCALFRIFKIKL